MFDFDHLQWRENFEPLETTGPDDKIDETEFQSDKFSAWQQEYLFPHIDKNVANEVVPLDHANEMSFRILTNLGMAPLQLSYDKSLLANELTYRSDTVTVSIGSEMIPSLTTIEVCAHVMQRQIVACNDKLCDNRHCAPHGGLFAALYSETVVPSLGLDSINYYESLFRKGIMVCTRSFTSKAIRETSLLLKKMIDEHHAEQLSAIKTYATIPQVLK